MRKQNWEIAPRLTSHDEQLIGMKKFKNNKENKFYRYCTFEVTENSSNILLQNLEGISEITVNGKTIDINAKESEKIPILDYLYSGYINKDNIFYYDELQESYLIHPLDKSLNQINRFIIAKDQPLENLVWAIMTQNEVDYIPNEILNSLIYKNYKEDKIKTFHSETFAERGEIDSTLLSQYYFNIQQIQSFKTDSDYLFV